MSDSPEKPSVLDCDDCMPGYTVIQRHLSMCDHTSRLGAFEMCSIAPPFAPSLLLLPHEYGSL